MHPCKWLWGNHKNLLCVPQLLCSQPLAAWMFVEKCEKAWDQGYLVAVGLLGQPHVLWQIKSALLKVATVNLRKFFKLVQTFMCMLCLYSAGNEEAFRWGHQGKHWWRACHGPAANHFLPAGLLVDPSPTYWSNYSTSPLSSPLSVYETDALHLKCNNVKQSFLSYVVIHAGIFIMSLTPIILTPLFVSRSWLSVPTLICWVIAHSQKMLKVEHGAFCSPAEGTVWVCMSGLVLIKKQNTLCDHDA